MAVKRRVGRGTKPTIHKNVGCSECSYPPYVRKLNNQIKELQNYALPKLPKFVISAPNKTNCRLNLSDFLK
jgi:hypothetical protein